MTSIEFVQLGGRVVSGQLNQHAETTADTAKTVLTGRCYQGPIRVGDIFTELTSPTDTYEVTLRVDSLRSYDNEVPEIYPSESAHITLSGSGLERLTVGVVLRG